MDSLRESVEPVGFPSFSRDQHLYLGIAEQLRPDGKVKAGLVVGKAFLDTPQFRTRVPITWWHALNRRKE